MPPPLGPFRLKPPSSCPPPFVSGLQHKARCSTAGNLHMGCRLLSELGARPGGKVHVVVTDLREELVAYVNGSPYLRRELEMPSAALHHAGQLTCMARSCFVLISDTCCWLQLCTCLYLPEHQISHAGRQITFPSKLICAVELSLHGSLLHGTCTAMGLETAGNHPSPPPHPPPKTPGAQPLCPHSWAKQETGGNFLLFILELSLVDTRLCIKQIHDTSCACLQAFRP